MIRTVRRDATKRFRAIANTCYKIIRHAHDTNYVGVPVALDCLTLITSALALHHHARLEERWGIETGQLGLFHYVLRINAAEWYEIHA